MEFYGEPATYWQTMRTWPHNATAIIIPGGGGHEQEITLSFADSEGGPVFDWDNSIPDFVEGLVRSALPETWRIDSRGTRLEIHPSGRFYGGFDDFDVAAVERVAVELGFKPEIRRF